MSTVLGLMDSSRRYDVRREYDVSPHTRTEAGGLRVCKQLNRGSGTHESG